MLDTIQDLDVVALLADLPSEGLERGQTGTVMLTHNNGEAFEVEFITRPTTSGKSVIATVERSDLLKLKEFKRLPVEATA